MAESSSVQSLDRAFDLLELLCRSTGGMTITALSEQTGLHKSTVHRLLSSMATRGFVMQDWATSVYFPGMHLCELASFVTENLDIVGRARAPMEQLAHKTGETVHLVMRDENEIVYLHKVESMHSAIRMFSRIGMRRPLYCTGVGKAILATWPDDEVDAVWNTSEIRAYTEHTIVKYDAFHRELDRIRRQGYAYDDEENEIGVRCIAAAVPDYAGRAGYAISISAPLSRMSDERMRELCGPLCAARNQIAAILGGAVS